MSTQYRDVPPFGGEFCFELMFSSLAQAISERCWCAGWMDGLEERLWDVATNPDDDLVYGQDSITPHEAEWFRAAAKSGLWAEYDDKTGDVRRCELPQ